MASVPTGPSGAPIVRGVELVRISWLPDQTAEVFDFDSPCFNLIQSKCFRRIWSSNDNFVLSAPTGSGKTAVLELAICRLFSQESGRAGHFKVVYQAPTKALCSERQRDWQRKFIHLGLSCQELTGDSDQAQLKHIQTADIIVTTPEKWDSITRKWKDHKKLMELIRLFLIDEVHILKEDRGASLEAIVSRMKTVGSEVRFIALSATIPNSDDVAAWLGKNPSKQDLPAAKELFDDSYRSVALEKHVYGYSSSSSNEFQFDQTLNHRLLEVIPKHSKGKPIMIFCITRKAAEITALFLAEWWIRSREQDRFWGGPAMQHFVATPNLQECMLSGVAFHHAGLQDKDRRTVERCFLEGQVSVICCTTTLSIGVNLPCHFVIIKNTVVYQTAEASCKELSDLDLVQMLGRAGRPQFDRSAVAVIMTRQEKTRRYEMMVSGQQVIESTLHNNLLEHINAEIGLGTVWNLQSAQRWLEGTFLFVRLSKNPNHYKVHGDNPSSNLDERARRICSEALYALEEYHLTTAEPHIRLTEAGDAMARYFIAFNTMKCVLGLPPKAKASEILSVIAQASEFKGIRIRSGEKVILKDINKSPMMKFPVKVDIAIPAHKVSIMIQACLGAIDVSSDNRYSSIQRQYAADISYVFQHIHRLIRCIIDCQIQLEDSIAARNALELSRSFAARAWDDSPLQMIQLEKIGPVAVRKLVGVGVRSIEDLENTEAQRIDMTLSKNPPFGANLLLNLYGFPKLRISLRMLGKPKKKPVRGVLVKVSAELGFLNDKPPAVYRKTPIHVCMLAETSDGHLVHFCRISGQKLGYGQTTSFEAALDNQHQVINGYAFCDDIAGTMKYATLHPKISEELFTEAKDRPLLPVISPDNKGVYATPQSQASFAHKQVPGRRLESEEDYDAPDDMDLMEAAGGSEPAPVETATSIPPPRSKGQLAGPGKRRTVPDSTTTGPDTLRQSVNQTDARQTKLMSNEGLEKPPRTPKAKAEQTKPSGNMQNFLKLSKSNLEKTVGSQKPTKGSFNNQNEARPGQRSSSPLYGEDADFYSDYEEVLSVAASRSPARSSERSSEKRPSLFMSDFSSPQKSSIDYVDVSDVPASNQAAQSSKRCIPPPPAIPSKRQKKVDEVETDELLDGRITGFSDLGDETAKLRSDAVGRDQESSAEALANANFEAWDAEAEDLFGHQRPGVESAERIDDQLQKPEPYDPLEDEDLDELFGQDMSANLDPKPSIFGPVAEAGEKSHSKSGPTTHSLHVSEGSAQQPAVPKTDSANANTETEHEPESTSKFNAWLIEQFGHCVEFV